MEKLTDYILNYLEKKDFKDVFLYPGGNLMHLLDSVRKSNLSYLCPHHEQAVAMAADGYARLTGKPGLAMVTSGPGGTNTITGVAGAWIDSVPLFVISGQSYDKQTIGGSGLRQLGVQEINILDIVKPITKYAIMIKDPQKIKYHLEKALHLATSGRPGPVWLDIPINIQGEEIDSTNLKGFNKSELEKKVDISYIKNKVEDSYKLLNNAERPVIVAGHGIKLSHSERGFLKLADYLSVPVVTTRNANDLIWENHPLYSGRPGSFGQRAANFTIQNSDVLLSVGSRLALAVTGWRYDSFARGAKKIVVDIDQKELQKGILKPDISVNCDVKDFVKEMLNQKNLYKKPNLEKWINKIHHWKKKYPIVLPEYKNEKDFVNTYYLIDILSDGLDKSDVIVTDMGASFQCTSQALKLKKGQRYLTQSGLAAMGYGLPGAIGACIGNNKKRTICLTGDGGLMMNLQELQTVKGYNLPLKIFILNNKGFSSIRETQKTYFDGQYVATDASSGVTFPDFIKLADALGIKNKRLSNQNNLSKNLREILDYQGPVVCDVNISEDEPVIPRQSPKIVNGKVGYVPIEDMAPFLSREELEKEMIIPIEE